MQYFLGRHFQPHEMYRLINMLIKREDKNFEVKELFGCPQVIFLDDNGKDIGDAVCHNGSYGHELGQIEIMGLGLTVEKDGDSVRGWMTAEDVLEQLDKFRNGEVQ